MAENKTKLICPVCGQELNDLFCPIHGERGVPKDTPAVVEISEIALVCPECNEPLTSKYCPIHGKEGVPPQSVNAEPVPDPVKTNHVCPKCGFKYQDNAVFCENCGERLSEITIIPNVISPIVINDSNCPRCRKDDKVNKVSAVVAEGVKIVDQSGPIIGVGIGQGGKIGVGIGGQSSSGKSVSAKSIQLMPPTKPKRLGCFVYGGLIFLGLAMSIDKRFAFMIILAIGLCILLFFNNNKKYEERMKVYEALNAQWNRLYYCDRDDLVFEPGTNFMKRAEEMQSYYEDSLK